jgi:uncharacterized protein (DUF4415 family)
MTDLKHQTKAQAKHYTYMSDVMRRLEWDLHNTIEMTGRIPEAWHQIARATPEAAGVKVNLRLEADVVKFFKSMGEGYGPRISAVLKSYMHARLAVVIKGAETLAHYRKREELHDAGKPQFGETARSLGQEWEDDGPPPPARTRVRMAEELQRRHSETGMKCEPEGWFRVR